MNVPETNTLWAIPKKSLYQVGETVNFLVRSNQSGIAKYTITEDKHTEPIIEEEVNLPANTVVSITAQLDYPGFLLFQLEQNGNKASAGTGIAPCDIVPTAKKPEDFDQFWDDQLDLLTSVPLNEKVTMRDDKSSDNQITYKVELDNIEGKKVYGWLSIPNCEGPFSAVLTIPSYGRAPIGPLTYHADEGVIAVTMSIHDYDCEKEVPKEIAYQPEDHYFDHRSNYYRTSILGAIQMINFINNLPEFDGKNLGITGVSQGGGLAIMVAGLDKRIRFLAQAQATFCDHTGILSNRPSGFPYWIVNADLKGGNPEALANEVAYYDATNFAENFEGVSFHSLGYKDDVCPPATVFAAYNKMRGEKYMLHGVENGHDLPQNFWPERRKFWEDHMPIKQAPKCELVMPPVSTDTEGKSFEGDVKILPVPIFSDIKIHFSLMKKSDVRLVLSSINGQVLGNWSYPNQFQGKHTLSLPYQVNQSQIGIVSLYTDGQFVLSKKVLLIR